MYLCRLIRTSTRSCAAAGAFYCSPSSPEDARPAIKAGDVLRKTRRFSAADVAEFAAVTGDRNPAHLDPDFACRVAGFDGGSVVHGMLVASLFPSVIASNFVNFLLHRCT
ncbi:transcription initiation factor TFIID subunit 9 / adenylate kinase [Apostasia shenzhenica]|uniref:Transcription initiation factor TFIID subunit 9 / adenylate kinase n=1 Tax=Apostasia shenzhenica TaxID=1088818 RepID=A0A2I0AHH0_9ASPA|nr:transcription initiation factor TFIID subunit 9 / adenylate kinase [Apostasia shenzhenica]